MNHNQVSFTRIALSALFGAVSLVTLTASAAGQSTEIAYPTAVISNELNGSIAARDIGDSRLTRHFYVFTGLPGDVIVSIESANLNGDIDVFTSVTLKPMTKVSLYASSASMTVARSIFLRQRESLILRVEARTPNDSPGTYRITFAGAFEPIASVQSVPDAPGSQKADSRSRNTYRVSSTGERLETPVVIAERKDDEPKPEESAAAAPKGGKRTTASPAPKKTPSARTARNTTPRTPARATRQPAASTPKPAEPAATTPAASNPGETKPTETPAAAPRQTEKPATQPPRSTSTQLPSAGRLVVERRDGTRTERDMNTVRRVVVENGMLIVVTKDGRIYRTPMAEVIRMSIEP